MKSIVQTLAILLVASCATVSAQTVDEIVAKNIEAHGGLKNLQAIKTMKSTGKLVQGGAMEFPFTNYVKRPGSMRIESLIQGQTFVMAYDGTTGWTINPFQGSPDPQKLPQDQVNELVDQADIDGQLVDYKKKGSTLEYIGKDEIEGSPVYKLKLTQKDGDIKYLYLDQETGIELKETSIVKQGDKEMEIDTYYSDYKEVNGVMIAHSMESRVGDQVGSQIVIEKVEVNVPVDDAMFAMPAAGGK
jgi:outer membrane lipoprotein-sorting protein